MSIHQLHDFTCSCCGGCLAGFTGQDCSLDEDGRFRIAIDCPACDSPLDLVIERLEREPPGVDLWSETPRADRRTEATRSGRM